MFRRFLANDSLAAEKSFAPLIYSRAGAVGASPISIANPIVTGDNTFSISFKLAAQGTSQWPDNATRGIIQMGTFGANSTLSIYRLSDTNHSLIIAKTWDKNGVNQVYAQSQGFFNTAGQQWSNSHQITVAFTNAGIYLYQDGVLDGSLAVANTDFGTLPSTMRFGDLGAGLFTYGAGISDIYICGPKSLGAGSPPTAIYELAVPPQFTSAAPAISTMYLANVIPAGGATKVVCLGDSITHYGRNCPRPYPYKLNFTLGTGYNIADAGFDGYQIDGVRGVYEATYQGHGYTYAIVLAGINDIISGTSGAVALTKIQTLYDEIRTDGLTLVPCTLTPFKNYTGWTSGKQTEFNTLNAGITAYATAHSLTLVDLYSGLGDGGSPQAFQSQYDSGDHLHPNQKGLDQISTLVRTAFP